MARIEQVIKSEAYSVLRSQQRSQQRDTLSQLDRGLDLAGRQAARRAADMVLLRRVIAEHCRQHKIRPTRRDVEILELLFAGYSISDIVRLTTMSRYEVKRSKEFWRIVLGQIDLRPQ